MTGRVPGPTGRPAAGTGRHSAGTGRHPAAGRRPGRPDTRSAILAAARRGFAERGYQATSLRSIAAEAAVDPALLVHYFGSKQNLFAVAVGLPGRPSRLLGPLVGLGPAAAARRLVRGYLALVDEADSRNAVIALVRSAVSDERAAATLREFLTAELLALLRPACPYPDAERRAALVAAQLVGIAMLRHVVRLPALAAADPEALVAMVAPTVEHYLAAPPEPPGLATVRGTG